MIEDAPWLADCQGTDRRLSKAGCPDEFGDEDKMPGEAAGQPAGKWIETALFGLVALAQ